MWKEIVVGSVIGSPVFNSKGNKKSETTTGKNLIGTLLSPRNYQVATRRSKLEA
jgi:hypothetical protein